jgi:hypothetical protein
MIVPTEQLGHAPVVQRTEQNRALKQRVRDLQARAGEEGSS